MGIDSAFYERLVEIGQKQHIFPGGSVAILGDCRFHTPWATGDNRVDLSHFGKLLGLARVETLDVSGTPTIHLDLHLPVPTLLHRKFDLIIDGGTVHCCFDVAAVLENCLAMLKENGSIIHLSALTGYFGRCYYNFNPLLFRDFYAQNGFELLAIEYQVTRTNFLSARLLQKWFTLRGRKANGFRPIPSNGLYLKRANVLEMEFGSDPAEIAHMLPNDAVMMVAARRTAISPFIRPFPSFFSR